MLAPYTRGFTRGAGSGRGSAGGAGGDRSAARARPQPEPGGGGQVRGGVHVPAQAGPVAGRAAAPRSPRARPPSPPRSADPAARPAAAASSTVPLPGASGTNRRTPGRPFCAASSAPASSAGRSAGRSAVSPATQPAAAPAAPCRNAAFRPASGSSGSTRAPAARRRRRHPGVVGDHQDLGDRRAGQHRAERVGRQGQRQLLVRYAGQRAPQPALGRGQPLHRHHHGPPRLTHVRNPASRTAGPSLAVPGASRHDFRCGCRGRDSRRGWGATRRHSGTAEAGVLATVRRGGWSSR